jgi:hypothetical protein
LKLSTIGDTIGFLDWNRVRLKMAIYRLLQNSPFGPVEIAVLTDAYERTLQKLSLVDRNDPLTELIAKKVIELAQRGVRDAGELSGLAIKGLGLETQSRASLNRYSRCRGNDAPRLAPPLRHARSHFYANSTQPLPAAAICISSSVVLALMFVKVIRAPFSRTGGSDPH